MNNAKKLLFTLLILFTTLIFQILIIIRLNLIDHRLDVSIAEASEKANISSIKENNEAASTDNTEQSSENNELINEDISVDDNILSNSLFIGDSRTEGLKKFTDASEYADFCCDVGININNLYEKDFFISDKNVKLFDAIAEKKYSKIFICIGFNELGWPYEDSFIEKYAALIDDIKKINSDCNIYIIDILHVTKEYSDINEYENNDRINLYNNKINEIFKNKDVILLDLNDIFSDSSGCLIDDTTTDGVHFTSEYYIKYFEALIQLIK